MFLALLVFTITAINLRAHLPPYTTDDDLVSRSDAIVEGHVDGGFAVNDTVPKEYRAIGFHVTDYRTVLIVTKVIKGQLQLGATPVIIHGSLRPVVLTAQTPIQRLMGGDGLPSADEKTGPQVPVGLFYPSTSLGMPPTADIHKTQIWFLREASLNPNVPEDSSAPGVRSQQDVQPLNREDYFCAILSGDPEALSPFASGDSWEARQARIAQGRLRVQRLDKIGDLELRADALMAFMQGEAPYSSAAQLAMSKLTALGPTGLKKLVPMFTNADHSYDRRAILSAWGKYPPAVPVIIAWLQSEGQWWTQQGTQNMIWSFQVGQKGGPEYNDPRAVSNRNVYCAVEALWNLGGPGTRDAVEQTRAQWAALGVRPAPGNDIVAICDQALTQLH
jgi:hypothetical protein